VSRPQPPPPPKPLCINGAPDSSYPDCCTNGARGQFCCENGANNEDCCENGGAGPFCCTNGARNPDCCENGGSGQYCCTNGLNVPNCELVTPPPLPPGFPPIPNLPKVIPVRPLPVKPEPEPEIQDLDVRIEENIVIPTLPPLPAFVSVPNLPKVIPIRPLVVSTPAPFIAPRIIPSTSAPEYLPPLDDPLDVRTSDSYPSWDSWKVKLKSFDIMRLIINV
jgi:hypothetical protein